jgi:hypothetical protein
MVSGIHIVLIKLHVIRNQSGISLIDQISTKGINSAKLFLLNNPAQAGPLILQKTEPFISEKTDLPIPD